MQKNEGIVRALLEYGADPNGDYFKIDYYSYWNQEQHERNEKTPLHYARSERIARLLINAGACVHIKDHKGDTPLHVCRTEGIARALIEAGANVHTGNDCWKYPLQNPMVRKVWDS